MKLGLVPVAFVVLLLSCNLIGYPTEEMVHTVSSAETHYNYVEGDYFVWIYSDFFQTEGFQYDVSVVEEDDGMLGFIGRTLWVGEGEVSFWTGNTDFEGTRVRFYRTRTTEF